jgi:hypothetical protein
MQSVNIHCLIIIHLFDQKNVFREPQCGGGVGDQLGVRGRVVVTSSSAIDNGGGDRRSRERLSRVRRRGDQRGLKLLE